MKHQTNVPAQGKGQNRKRNLKTKAVFYFRPDPRKPGRWIEAEVVEGRMVDTEGNVYRQNPLTRRYECTRSVPASVKSQIDLAELGVEMQPEIGRDVYLRNGDVARWQYVGDDDKLKLVVVQKAKTVTLLSPNDASRHGKHPRR